MILSLAGRSVLVAAIAGAIAALPAAILLTIGMDAELRLTAIFRMLLMSLAGTIVIGLPAALLVYRPTKDDAEFGFRKLLFAANSIAVTLIGVLAAWQGMFGVIFFGVPTFLAANVFAIAGWKLVLKPYRVTHFA